MTGERKPRRRRCRGCDALTDPADLADGLCPTCVEGIARGLEAEPDPDPSVEPYSAAIARPFAERNGDAVTGDGTGEALPPLPDDAYPPDAQPIPAPSVAPALPDLDLLTEDERAERDWAQLPNLKLASWPLRRGRITASALACFARCPEQFRRKYVLGQPDPTGGAGLTGTAIHSVLASAWRFKMAQGEDAPLAALERAFDGAFDGRVEREEAKAGAVDWGHDGSREKRPMMMDNWRARGKEALGSYAIHIAPRIEPHATEELFVVAVAGLAVPVVGFLDLRTDRAMVDVKFGSKKQSMIAPDWRVQGLTYLLAHDLPMTWHSLNWKGEFRTPADSAGLILERTAEAYSIALDLIRAMTAGVLAYAERFGLDQPWPGNVTHTWACSTCAYEPTCHWWHRPLFDTGALI